MKGNRGKCERFGMSDDRFFLPCKCLEVKMWGNVYGCVYINSLSRLLTYKKDVSLIYAQTEKENTCRLQNTVITFVYGRRKSTKRYSGACEQRQPQRKISRPLERSCQGSGWREGRSPSRSKETLSPPPPEVRC